MTIFKKLVNSEGGIAVISIMLGLGMAGLFKMSCDSRSCIVYKGPDFSEKRQIKTNNKCYSVSEEFVECDDDAKKIYI